MHDENKTLETEDNNIETQSKTKTTENQRKNRASNNKQEKKSQTNNKTKKKSPKKKAKTSVKNQEKKYEILPEDNKPKKNHSLIIILLLLFFIALIPIIINLSVNYHQDQGTNFSKIDQILQEIKHFGQNNQDQNTSNQNYPKNDQTPFSNIFSDDKPENDIKESEESENNGIKLNINATEGEIIDLRIISVQLLKEILLQQQNIIEKQDSEEILTIIESIENIYYENQNQESKRISESKLFTISSENFVELNKKVTYLIDSLKNYDIQLEYSKPLSNGIWITEQGDAGKYLLKLTIKIKENEFSENILLSINEKNQTNSEPVIIVDDLIRIKENQTLYLEYSVYDPDNDKLSVTFDGWLNSSSKHISFDDQGIHQATITLSDGKINVSKNITIIVEDLDRKPIINISRIIIKKGEIIEQNLENINEKEVIFETDTETSFETNTETSIEKSTEPKLFYKPNIYDLIYDPDEPNQEVTILSPNFNAQEHGNYTINLKACYKELCEEKRILIEVPEEFEEIKQSIIQQLENIESSIENQTKENSENETKEAIKQEINDNNLHQLILKILKVEIPNTIQIKEGEEVNIDVKIHLNKDSLYYQLLDPETQNKIEESIDDFISNIKIEYSGWMNSSKKIVSYDNAGIQTVVVNIPQIGINREIVIQVEDVNREPVIQEVKVIIK